MTDRNEKIADLLMGAAYADKHLDGREYDKVVQLMATVMNVDAIDDGMTARLKGFSPDGFDAASVARDLGLQEEEEKRHLLELLAAVTDADEILDLDESDYLEAVANALDLPRATFTDLTIEVLEVGNLQAAGKKLKINPSVPPPPPDAKK